MSETIVIGGGIAGLSAAWRLCREGHACTVVEAGKTGNGASRVAAGYCEPGLEPDEISAMEWESLRLWPQMAKELEAETNCEIDFRTDGQLRIAYPDTEAELLADTARRRELGWQVRVLSGSEARVLEPGLSEEVSAAVLLPQVSWVDGRKACAALAAAIEARGGRIVEGVRVERLTIRDGRVSGVETSGGPMPADRVLVASGHLTNDIAGLPADLPASYSVKGVILTLKTDRPLVKHLVKTPQGVICPRNDGRLIVGVTRHVRDTTPLPAAGAVRTILESAVRAVPALEGLPLTEVNVGFRPYLEGDVSVSGAAPGIEGLFYSLGHMSDGYLRAPLMSLRVAEAMLA
ncbi:NAD(P)/FAD-dependent oxidoreductase [Oricola nitratireducens]|uniref:NAD(P)/FAD-dependent oxidoreductase n=1 Tax=Oricola nitratireducens TaxID=2775868 RepID=UPI001868F2AF|nr:FAD-dependent oxidoreductase [Oricola nitratireducens]